MLLAFGIPLTIYLMFNFILYLMTIISIYFISTATSPTHAGRSSGWYILINAKVASLMGFTWILGILAWWTDALGLWYAFNVLNALQGLAIGLAFGITPRNVRLWKMSLKK